MKRWSVSMGLVAVVAGGVACGRSLAGAPCPCVDGHTCCPAVNACYPIGECPGSEDQPGSGGTGGGNSGGKSGGGSAAHGGAGSGKGGPDGGAVGGGSGSSEESGGSSSSGASGGAGGSGAAGGVTAGEITFPEFCSSDGWCGARVNYAAGFAIAANDVWIAANQIRDNGAPSAFLHFDGATYQNYDLSGTAVVNSDVHAIWAAAPDDVWAVGSLGAIYHFDGSSWSGAVVPVTVKDEHFGDFTIVVEFRGVSGSAANDVWAVGGSGAAVHFDGSSWSGFTSISELRGVWAGAADDVWAVGVDGVITHYDGSEWTPYGDDFGGTVTSADLEAVWGAAGDDVWAIGSEATLLHFDGTRWQDSSASVPLEGDLKSIWGSAFDNVWVAATDGTLMHFDGSGWYKAPVQASAPLRAVFGDPDGGVWAAGEAGRMLRWRGEWSYTPGPSNLDVRAMWTASSGDLLAIGASGWNAQWDGSEWAGRLGNYSLGDITRCAGASANDFWYTYGNTLVHYDGADWNYDLAVSTPLRGLWANAADDIWTVGEAAEGQNGYLAHFDGDAWTEYDSGTPLSLTSVWGSAWNDVWATTEKADVLRFDGSAWRLISVDAGGASIESTSWRMVTGSAANDVWLLGGYSWSAYKAGGFAFSGRHFDGTDFSAPVALNVTDLRGAWVDAGGAWLVGSNNQMGGVVHFDGSEWKIEHTGIDFGALAAPDVLNRLNAVGGTATDLFAAGTTSAILRKRR